MSRRNNFKFSILSGQSALLLFLSAAFLTGSLVGCLFAGSLSDCSGLVTFLEKYAASVQADSFDMSFLSVLFDTARIPFLVFLLSVAPLGPVGIPVVFFYRGFCFCYAVSSFYAMSGLKGLFGALLLFGISAVLWMPVMFILGVQGMRTSGGILSRFLYERRGPACLDRRYFLLCAVCFVGLILCALIEYWGVPALVPVLGEFL